MKASTLFFLLLSIIVAGCVDKKKEPQKEPLAPKKSDNPTTFTKPPAIGLTVLNTDAFIAWASSSGVDEKEKVRDSIKKASTDAGVLGELIKRFEKVDTTDIGYSLVVLSIIGELQNPAAQSWLEKQVNRPLPKTVITPNDGLSSLDLAEMIAGKAAESLAYLKTPASDRALLNIISKHPSRTVRSAAIDAYLFNNGDAQKAKEQLRHIVQPVDSMLLDRVRFSKSADKKQFNAAQEKFYQLHASERYQAPGKAGVKEVKKPDSISIDKPIAPPASDIKH